MNIGNPSNRNPRVVTRALAVPAFGMLTGGTPNNALARGYAVLSSDSGHDGQANPTAS